MHELIVKFIKVTFGNLFTLLFSSMRNGTFLLIPRILFLDQEKPFRIDFTLSKEELI